MAHTYRFELGEHAQRSYVDGVLVREYAREVPQGTAWSFSAGTWHSTTPAQIDSITVQAQRHVRLLRALSAGPSARPRQHHAASRGRGTAS